MKTISEQRKYKFFEFQTQNTNDPKKFHRFMSSDDIAGKDEGKKLIAFKFKVNAGIQKRAEFDRNLRTFIDLGVTDYKGRFVLVEKTMQTVQ